MRKHLFLFALIGMVTLAFTACQKKQQKSDDPTPTQQDTITVQSFPKKHLLEEFTGQGCGYCPYGMDCVEAFMKNDPNWVLVLHHTYGTDNFTINGSTKIGNQMDITSAPTIAINRQITNYGADNGLTFHPGYLEYTDKAQFETTTYASVNIKNTYDEASRSLEVVVSGLIGKKDYPALKLTVLIKESGMIDYQSDYDETFEGWQEFRHANAARAFLTAPLGDAISVNARGEYSDTLSVTLSNKWVAENCMVVAYLSEDFQPIVQANESPVVNGTTGGAELTHKRITKVAIPDYYPEPGATTAPKDYTNLDVETLTYAEAGYKAYPSNGFNYWTIITYNKDYTFYVNNIRCIPFAYIYLFTELNATTIPNGTYEFSTTPQVGKAYAGFRNDTQFYISGSKYYHTSLGYFNQGYAIPEAQWLIASGQLTITDDGWSIQGKARNGATINLVGTTPITYPQQAPARKRFMDEQGRNQAPFEVQ